MNMNAMPFLSVLLRNALVTVIPTAAALAQASGNHVTNVAKDADNGKMKIEVKDKQGNLTVGKVWIWVPMTESWVEVMPTSIKPNPGDNPTIKLPSGVRSGDKFKIEWKSDSPNGGVRSDSYV